MVVGAAGGVGTSTLARDLDYLDLQRRLPGPSSRPLVVATRTTADGMTAAIGLVQQLQDYPGRVVIALVDDGCGPAPIAVKARRRLLDGYVHAVVDVPYVPVWRYSGTAGRPTANYRDEIRRLGLIAAPVTYT